jgi:hypothetical protein
VTGDQPFTGRIDGFQNEHAQPWPGGDRHVARVDLDGPVGVDSFSVWWYLD